MVVPTRVTTQDLIRAMQRKTGQSREEMEQMLALVCDSVREFLEQGSEVELGDLFALAVHGGPEIREDESGGFSAFAATEKSLTAKPIGGLKTSLDRSCQQGIYYVSERNGDFHELLEQHFGRRGWTLIHVPTATEVHKRTESNPPAAVIFESHVEGWEELVRELKCDPRTNNVPVVGIFPEDSRDMPLERVTVLPDEIVYEPFDFREFIQTAAMELADRVATPQNDVMEIQLQLPGARLVRKQAYAMLREVLHRCDLGESFIDDACAAFGEALDNAHRHGHCQVDCCTIDVRVILDPRRLVLVVRDTGQGFDHATTVAAARGSALDTDVPHARRGEIAEAGIARMFTLVDRLDYNQPGNEVVLTKAR